MVCGMPFIVVSDCQFYFINPLHWHHEVTNCITTRINSVGAVLMETIETIFENKVSRRPSIYRNSRSKGHMLWSCVGMFKNLKFDLWIWIQFSSTLFAVQFVCMYARMYIRTFMFAQNLTDCHGDAMKMYHCAQENMRDFRWAQICVSDSDGSRTVSGSEFQTAGPEQAKLLCPTIRDDETALHWWMQVTPCDLDTQGRAFSKWHSHTVFLSINSAWLRVLDQWPSEVKHSYVIVDSWRDLTRLV